jgi:hypothetical protein
MIELRTLPDDNPDLQHSPSLRVALLTLNYAREHGPIPLTKSRALQRVFVHWAAEHFVWSEQGIDELLCNQKVLNEQDFLPLELPY